MNEIKRYDINENWAHAGIVEAGDYCFINYCVRNIGGTVEEQVDGAFDEMEERLALAGLTLENVVQMNCLFKNIWDIPVMEQVDALPPLSTTSINQFFVDVLDHPRFARDFERIFKRPPLHCRVLTLLHSQRFLLICLHKVGYIKVQMTRHVDSIFDMPIYR